MGNQCYQPTYSSRELDLKDIRSTYFSFHAPTPPVRPSAIEDNSQSSMVGKHHRRQSSSLCVGDNTCTMMNLQNSIEISSEPAAIYRTRKKTFQGSDQNRSTMATTALSTMGAVMINSPTSRRSKGFKVLQPSVGEDEEWEEAECGQLESHDYYSQTVTELQKSKKNENCSLLIQEYRDNIITPKASKIELPPFPFNEAASRNQIHQSLIMRTPHRSQPYLTCCSSTIQLSKERLQSIPFNYGDRNEEIDQTDQPCETEETLEGQKENLRLQAQKLYFLDQGSISDEMDGKLEDIIEVDMDDINDIGLENSQQGSQIMIIQDFDLVDSIKELQQNSQDLKKDTLLEPNNNKSNSGGLLLDGSSDYQQIDIEILEDSQNQSDEQQTQPQQSTTAETLPNTHLQDQIMNLKQQLLELQNPLVSEQLSGAHNREETSFNCFENGHRKSSAINRGHVRSIFDITERNEESEATGGKQSLLSNIFNRVDSKHQQSNRCISQTFRFSNLSNNLMSQNNLEITEQEVAVVAESVETEHCSLIAE